MIVLVQLAHKRLKLNRELELWDLDAREITNILQHPVISDRTKILNGFVTKFINGKIPAAFRDFKVTSWEFRDHGVNLDRDREAFSRSRAA